MSGRGAEGTQGLEPFIQGSGEVAVFSGFDDGLVDSDRAGDDGEATGHVLDELVAAFAAFEGFIGQGHEADIELLDVGDFGGFAPRADYEGDVG